MDCKLANTTHVTGTWTAIPFKTVPRPSGIVWRPKLAA